MKGILILVLVFFAVFLAAFIFMICYKGGNKSRKFNVLKKYIDNNPVAETGKKKKSGVQPSKYVVVLKEKDKENSETYRCEKEVYDKLRIGRTAEVVVKSGNIVKFIK